MSRISHYSWDLTEPEARALQADLASKVVREDRFDRLDLVGGADVSTRGVARAALVVLRYPLGPVVEASVAECPLEFPYIPGLLSFREAPALLEAYARLSIKPDVLLVDGHGFAHPRRLGLASHLGLLLDCPTIGCAKSILLGHCATPTEVVGDWTPLMDENEVIGGCVRTRARVKPLYVSIGHRVSLESAVRIVLACCRGYRLPEPIRWAHRVAGTQPGETVI